MSYATVDFDPGPGIDNQTGNGAFLSKFDPGGNFVWARVLVGTSESVGWSVAIDSFGNPCFAGQFKGTVDFDPGPGVDNHTANGEWGAFLCKFDPGGNFIWALTWGGSGETRANSVAVDSSGNAYVTGEFEGTLDFDPGADVDTHASSGHMDGFLSKFNSDGKFLGALTWGEPHDDDRGDSVACDGAGNVYIAGSFHNEVDFDPGSGVDIHISNGIWDASLSKFDSNGYFLWARSWGGWEGDEFAHSIAIDLSANAYVVGDFDGSVDFDPGSGVSSHKSNGMGDVYLSKFDTNGNFISALTWGGPVYDYGESVATDGSSCVVVTGFFDGQVDFDPGAGVDIHSSNGGGWTCYLVRFDTNANFNWARTWGGLDSDQGVSAALDSAGNAFAAGYFQGTSDFDPGVGVDDHTSNGNFDAFLSKFPPDGNW